MNVTQYFKKIPQKKYNCKSEFLTHFVSFNDIDRDAYNECVDMRFGMDDYPHDCVNLKNTQITGRMSKWCKENRIYYRKMKYENDVIFSSSGKRMNDGIITHGLYFSTPEFAMAFRLRWC